jgi:hypothetical protein
VLKHKRNSTARWLAICHQFKAVDLR